MGRTLWMAALAAALGLAGYVVAEPSQAPSPSQPAEQPSTQPAKPQTREQARQTKEQARQEAIDKILSQPLPDEAYSQPERCLASHKYDVVDILDDRHLVFRGRGDNLWLNVLRSRCVGLRPRDVLRFDMQGNRVCNLDTFQAYDQFMGIKGGICSLGDFTPVTPEQVDAIKAAVQETRKR